jgi:3-phenylpropionate/trans-cinnamate dioxygenase ferredoxin reductase subunit
MTPRYDVLVVGAGHAGAQVALSLRQRGFEGSIAIVGDEPYAPYDRPPLSKDYLLGSKTFERMLLRPTEIWEELSVVLMPCQRVEHVDPDLRRVRTRSGTEFDYGWLIWATGGAPRKLACAGNDLRGVHTIRTRDDVDRLGSELQAASSIVIIGGGYIGLEAASVLRRLDKNVTVLEAQDRVLSRVAGYPISQFYEEVHRERGVDLRTGAAVECIEGKGSAVRSVEMADGTSIPASIVIVGIGIEPAIQPLLDAGAACNGGVLIDGHGRTSLPHVFAIGDCAAHKNEFAGGAVIRLESVQNANDQAKVVAGVLTGSTDTYRSVPWFWSDQYDLYLKTIGLSLGHDQTVVRGDPLSRRFSVVYLRQSRVIALDCVNTPADYAQGRALVMLGAAPDQTKLADTSMPLKALL